MPLIQVSNQPVSLRPFVPDQCNLGDNKSYCALFNVGDQIYQQWKQSSCDSNIACDPGFDMLTGPLINPGFDNSLSGWTVTGNWVWSNSGRACISSGTGGELAQTADLVSGTQYVFTFDVINFVSGNINIIYGGQSESITITGDGTYSTSLLGIIGTDFSIQQAGFIGCVDNISVQGNPQHSTCWTANEGWILTSDGAIHTPGLTNTLELALTFIGMTGYQQYIISASNIIGGSVTVSIGGGDIGVISQGGVYMFYSNLGTSGDTLVFTPSIDFDGRINSTYVFELRQDYTALITDLSGISVVADITTDISYGNVLNGEPYAILKFDSTDFPEGCYLLKIIDPCSIQDSFIEHFADTGFDDPSAWAVVTDHPIASITLSSFQQSASSSTVTHSFASQGFSPPTGMQQVKVSFTTGTVGNSVIVGVYGSDGSTQTPFYELFPLANTTYSAIFNLVFDLSLIELGVRITSSGAAGVTQILNVSFQTADLNTDQQNISNCFSLQTEQDCAKLIEGYLNAPAVKLGMFFPGSGGSSFRISSRVRVLKFNPFYPIEADDYTYSDSSRRLNYASREKYWEILFDYMDEVALDALTTAMLSDVFTIDDIQYYVKTEDFKPEWNKDGRQRLAQLRVNLREVVGTIYNSKT